MINSTDIVGKWLNAQENIERYKGDINHYSNTGYWKEVAGVFILSQRQTGKSTALKGFVSVLKKLYPENRVVAVFPYSGMIDNFGRDHADVNLVARDGFSWLSDAHPSNSHLVVDEFMYLVPGAVDTLLTMKWKSVTMIGTMK